MAAAWTLADMLAAVRCPDATHKGAIRFITWRNPADHAGRWRPALRFVQWRIPRDRACMSRIALMFNSLTPRSTPTPSMSSRPPLPPDLRARQPRPDPPDLRQEVLLFRMETPRQACFSLF
jgi:hypothetical protein